ncbi:MAG TPA: hypothetical protein VFJ56_00265, partial [Nitrospira sp.]|nr:hypothetical protein [Nitrospira sp.]
MYVEGLSDTRTKVGEGRVSTRRGWVGEKVRFFPIPSTDGNHAIESNPRPPLLIFRHGNVVDDMPVGEILHGPTQMSAIDPEHRGALADGRGEKK